jgi:methyl-accepting chemotaxis protein
MKLTLGKKIFFSLTVLTATLIAVGAVGYQSIATLSADLEHQAGVFVPATRALGQLDREMTYVQSNERALNLTHYDAAQRRSTRANLTKAFRRADEARAVYAPLPKEPEQALLWQRFVPAWEAWQQKHQEADEAAAAVDRAVDGGASVDDATVVTLRRRAFDASVATRPTRVIAEGLLEELVASTTKSAEDGATVARGEEKTAAITIVIALLLGCLITAVTGVFLSRDIAGILRSLMVESEKLTAAVLEGRTSARAEVESINFEFRPVVQGMNATMEAFAKPLGVASNYVERISRGEIPQKITDDYRGEFNVLKNNLNTCIDAVRLLVSDAAGLAKAAVEGKLKTRADASRHQGDFARVVAGVNDTLDAVIKPIEESAGVLAVLANRDLRARVTGNYQGDHANMKNSINTMADSLHAALTQVTTTTDQLSAASEQIAASSQTVSQGTTEQASALEETASTLEEIASMTRQNADNTLQAKTLAQATKVAADAGNVSMAQMIESMGKIRAAAEGTAEIIRDINEIAFQTNLLALNAAVEAARAGDAGRGFAVVAEEVRNLALRSKDAAKKTEELIRQSVKLAEEGGTISHAVNGNLAGIVASVGKVTNIVGEIAVASQEQARGVEQVNKAIAQMEQVVQQSAANSEETSSSAAELSSQAQDLAALVGSFQLGTHAPLSSPHRLAA